eukprot:712418-Pyramimonas_sp.AAC.1
MSHLIQPPESDGMSDACQGAMLAELAVFRGSEYASLGLSTRLFNSVGQARMLMCNEFAREQVSDFLEGTSADVEVGVQ